MQDRFEELLGMLLDDDISDDQANELFKIVAADPLKVRRLREHLVFSDRLSQYEDEMRDEDRFLSSLQVRMHASKDTEDFVSRVVESIKDEAEEVCGQRPLQHSQVRESRWERSRRMAGWGTLIAVLFVPSVMLVRSVFNRGRDETLQMVAENVAEPVGVNESGVAVLTRVADLQGVTANWRVGQTIPQGSMEWDAGYLQLEFYCGATVVVEGPAEIEILDESRVVCRLGRLRAHVPVPARGFAVLAPSFELVDLGTEFGLSVTSSGESEVHVFDGKVELYDAESNRSPATRRELSMGDALTVDRDGGSKAIAAQDADFVTPTRLSQMANTCQRVQLREWRAFRDWLKKDPRVVAYFPFERIDAEDRLLVGHGVNGTAIDGAIVGCEWSAGRWRNKASLQFKRPGDRVRINVPGEFESLTYSTWLRVDGLDRQFNSLLLTDGFDKNKPHWQIRQDGSLVLGMLHGNEVVHGYKTDSIFNLFRLGQWVHLVTVCDGVRSCVTHYVNGELAKQERLIEPASGLLSIGEATIGNWSQPTLRKRSMSVRNLNGCIDELIVFGEALDSQEVRHIYEVGRP